jgi:dipeptidyl-peptidase-3
VNTYYEEDETFQQVFGGFGPSFEECRAETTSLYLAFRDEVLEMYGIPPEKRKVFKLCAALDMLHAGIKTLTCYAPDVVQWKQAHARARFGVLRAALIWGRGSVSLKLVDGRYKLFVDPDKLDGLQDAIELLLKYLNYYKSAKLPNQAKEFYGALTAFDDFWLDVRKQAMLLKTPRSVNCGAVVRKVGDGYSLERVRPEPASALDEWVSIVDSVRLALE